LTWINLTWRDLFTILTSPPVSVFWREATSIVELEYPPMKKKKSPPKGKGYGKKG